MRSVLRLLAALVVCALGGCANFTAVKKFAADTNAMTGTVRAEMQQVARLCEFPADMQLLLDEANGVQGTQSRGKSLKEKCASVASESIELQKLTIDTLDL